MIYQQANPGIYYEYTIPLHKPSDTRGVGGDVVTGDDDYYDYSSYSYYEVITFRRFLYRNRCSAVKERI